MTDFVRIRVPHALAERIYKARPGVTVQQFALDAVKTRLEQLEGNVVVIEVVDAG